MASKYTQADSAQHMYNSRASKYDDSHHPIYAQYIVDSLDLQPGQRLLDLACGTGLVTLPAAKKVGAQGLVSGVDISDGMMSQLRSKISQAPDQYPHVSVTKGDITRLDDIESLQKGSFNAISCASALVLLQEPGVALQKWADYLKPGGRLITDATHPRSLPNGTAFEAVYRRLGVEPPFNRVWSQGEASFEKLLQQAGYEVEKIWFKESTGEGTKYHSIDEADEQFEAQIYNPSNKALVDRGSVDEARILFREEWAKLDKEDGKIVEVDGVFVGIARKPLPLPTVGYGSCACGAISWSTTAEPTSSSNCHCSSCRKISGSPYITFMDLPLSKVLFDPPLGKPHMKIFSLSAYAERGFCKECGSTLTMWYKNDPDVIGIAAGSIDEGKSRKHFYHGPKRHIYVKDVPTWYEVPSDSLSREETMASAEKLLVIR